MTSKITPGDSSRARPNSSPAEISPARMVVERLNSTKLISTITVLSTKSAPPTPNRVRAVT